MCEDSEKHLYITLEDQTKIIANNKIELGEDLKTRQQDMAREFEQEMYTVKQKYQEAIVKVEEASTTLQKLFRKKVGQIKEKSALFFAKLEMKLKESNDEVLKISSTFRDWQETLQGPTQKYDAQIFTLKNVVSEAEIERETEFGLMKNVVANLIHALEDKT